MAIDNKYGKVDIEHGSIAEDEPVVVFRARDELLPDLLDYYEWLCAEHKSPRRHLLGIREAKYKVQAWQANHTTKIPDSEESRAWKGE